MYRLPEVPTIEYNGRTFYQIEGASKYYVSVCGQVLSTAKKRPTTLTQADNGIGYLQVWLSKRDNGKKPQWKKLHRLVAERFLPNPDNLPEVNHLDKNRANCHVDNLEWVTHRANIQHSYDTGRVVKRGVEHYLYGMRPSDTTRAKQAEAKLGERHPKFVGWYITPAGRYASAPAAAEANGTYAKQVLRWCKGGKMIDRGWDFEPAQQAPAMAQAA